MTEDELEKENKELKEEIEDLQQQLDDLNDCYEELEKELYNTEDELDKIKLNLTYVNFEDFIFKLKNANLYTSEFEEFMENYERFYM